MSAQEKVVGKTYLGTDGAKRKVLKVENDMVEFVFIGREAEEHSYLSCEHFSSLAKGEPQ